MHGKQKTLSLGTCPVVSLKEFRAGRDKAKEILAKGGRTQHREAGRKKGCETGGSQHL
jgi:hypothetical protein